MSSKSIPLKPGQTYHIWTHANGDDNIFREKENYDYFLKKYSHYIYPVADTFAYCLMPNHLHLMVRFKNENDIFKLLKRKKRKNLQGFQNLGGFISQQFSNLFNAYTKAYNKKYNRKGSLFIPNFKRKLIDSDEYFTQLIVYIHKNPIHHGFVEHTEGWPYSSWFAYQQNKPTKIKKDEALNWFSGPDNFDAAHEDVNADILASLFED